MTRSALPRKRIVTTLCSLVFVEWLLFELTRSPYRPPDDMLTFLGTEKYAVMALMVVIAVYGFALIVRWALCSFWTERDVIVVTALVTSLLAAIIFVVFLPAWPVTPFRLLLK